MALSLGAMAQFGPQQQFMCESPRSVDLADMDQDGDLDLVIASRQGLGFYRNLDGTGSFAQPTFLGTEETIACTADVNGDGQDDIVASRENNNGIVVFINDGTGSFGTAVTLVAGASAEELGSTDLEEDGDIDIFYSTAAGALQVTLNSDGLGLFTTPIQLASLPQLASVQSIDVDGDGDKDLSFSSRVANEVDVCFYDQGWFMPQEQLTVAGHGPVTDIDNDGFSDVVVANIAAASVAWQRNGIDQPGFESPQMLDQSFNSPDNLAASDLDGDGDKDIVVTSASIDEVAWYEHVDGIGGYGPRQTVCTGVPASAIATGDVDGDGDKDLFICSAELNKVIWYTNLTNATGKVMGRVFNDINGDGLFNGNDHGLLNMRVEGGDLGATYTNASGFYWFDAVPASYVISKPAETNWQFTTVQSYTATVPTQGVSANNDFGLQASTVLSELTPELGSAPMRCAMQISYWTSVMNTGNQVSDVHLQVDVDDLSSFLGADPAPNSVENGVATWIFPNVQPTHQRMVHFIVLLPGSDHVGETLVDQVEATAYIMGMPVSTDTKIYDPVLLCAVDPNDKQVMPRGIGAANLTAMGSELFFTVRFQNTGNAPAENVVVLDTLDGDLDLSTLRVLNSSHTYRALLQTDGVLRFSFDGINLPDSGSDYLGSQGFVRFAVQHIVGLPEGTPVHNTADIYFDNNAPVITNTTLSTLTYGDVTAVTEVLDPAQGVTVFPNPAQGTATVHLSNALEGRIDLQLFDLKGGLVQQISRRSNTLLIQRNDLPDGTYVLRVMDERGNERVTRLAFE